MAPTEREAMHRAPFVMKTERDPKSFYGCLHSQIIALARAHTRLARDGPRPALRRYRAGPVRISTSNGSHSSSSSPSTFTTKARWSSQRPRGDTSAPVFMSNL